MIFPIALLILSGPGIVSQAFATTTMTLETDSHVYDHASVIIVTGNIDPVDLGGSEITIICKSPVGGVCGLEQISPDSNGDFSAMFDTSSKLLKYDGVYQFQAQYSSLASATVSVELVDATETTGSESESPQMGTAVSGTITEKSGVTLHELGAGQIEYDMTCDAEPAFFANSDDDGLVIYIEPVTDGIITLTLHEELIKPFDDGTFAVIINNQECRTTHRLEIR